MVSTTISDTMELSSGGIKMKIILAIGTVAALSRRCYASDYQEDPGSCNPGWELCPTTRTHCVPKMCRDVTGMDAETQRCPAGLVFCGETINACIKPCLPASFRNNPSAPLQPPPCGPGQYLCMRTNTCGNKTSCDEDSMTPRRTCRRGFTFCMELGGCVLGRCPGSRATSPVRSCSPGTYFCVATSTCASEGECGGVGSLDGRGPAVPTEVCPPDKVFCLDRGTCEVAGSCGGRPPESMDTMCPRGYIYCLQKGECVSARRGCNNRPRAGVSCPPGSVFSLLSGKCVSDSNGDKEIFDLHCQGESFGHTTCLSNQHCPLGFTCCPDSESLHLQCMDANGNTDEKSINMTCLFMGKPKHDTGINCSHPRECPVTTVCCSGRCMSHKGTSSCPPRTLYCPLTNSCRWLGKSCGQGCPPNFVYCVPYGRCTYINECEKAWEVPWTLPGPLRLSSNCNVTLENEMTVSDIYDTTNALTMGTSEVSFTVENLTTWFGTWLLRKPTARYWIPVTPTSKLTPSHYLSYIPHQGLYAFGLDHINMTEEESGIKRKLVQLVVPEFAAVQITEVAVNISLKENTPKNFRLADIVNVTCEDDPYWREWEMGFGLPKQASDANLLDGAHPAVVSWVGSLQQPHLNVEMMQDVGEGDIQWESGGDSHEGRGDEHGKNHGSHSRARPELSEGTDGRSRQRGERDGATSNRVGERGLWLEWIEPPATRIDVKIDISLSLDGGGKWDLMNHVRGIKVPLSSCESVQDILVKMSPALNTVGSPKLRIKVFPTQNTQMCSTSQTEYIITLEIEEVNDPPLTRAAPDRNQIPYLIFNRNSTGTQAHTYASAFYIDPDEGTLMSIVILQAYGGSLGTWQVSVDDGATYQNIVGLENDTVLATLGLAASHRGIVDIEEMRDKNKCDFTSTDPSNNECVGELKNMMENSGGMPTATGPEGDNQAMSERSDTGRRLETSPLRGQRQFADFGTGNAQLFTEYPMRAAFYVPATALIRFQSNREYWTLPEARQETRLVFLSSDYSIEDTSPKAKMINISLARGWEMEGGGNIARDPVVMSAEWKDCSGQVVVSGEPRVMDACGICGGDNTSCTDCNGDLFGNASFVCLECVGGNTGKPSPKLDCLDKCGEENFVAENNNVCTPKGHEDITFCDGTINDCGFCVEGTTGLPQSYGKDRCGVCGNEDKCVGCDHKINSGATKDICGVCHLPDDPEFNDCKSLRVVENSLDCAVNNLKNAVLDQAGMTEEDLSSFLTIEADVAGVKPTKYVVENCTLVKKDVQEATNAVIFKKEKVKASFKELLCGKMNLTCDFKAKRGKNPKKIDVQTQVSFEILNSSAVEIEIDKAEVNASSDTQVTLTIKNPSSLDDASCFLIYQDQPSATGVNGNLSDRRGRGRDLSSHQVQELSTDVIETDQVTCFVPENTRPGQAQIGLALTDVARLLNLRVPLNLPTKPLMIKASAPQVTSAILDPLGEVLVINFNQNIESQTECSLLFEWDWLDDSKTPAPKCKFQASRLRVKIGSGIKVMANMSLTFADSNGIRALHGDAATAPEARGSFIVSQPETLSEIMFDLDGDIQACNSSWVKVAVTRVRGARIEELKPKWNITWEPGNVKWSQAETLKMWESVYALRDNMKTKTTRRGFSMKVPGSGFLPDKEYMVVVQLETPDGQTSTAQGRTITTMPSDQVLKVSISGPSRIRADSREKFKAKVSVCSETESVNYNSLEYFWNMDGEGVLADEQRGRRFILPKSILKGGRLYTLSATVLSDDPHIMGIGRFEMMTISQGLELITSADSLKVGSVSPIKIDASKSKDLDNLPGAISFKYWCKKEDGSGCYVTSGQTLTRLENILSREQLSSPRLKIPGSMLVADRYIITVEISKGNVSAQKDVSVEVSAGRCALITSKPSATVFNPQEKIRVPTFITGPADLKVQWISVEETGYMKADISRLPVGKEVTLSGESKERDHDLVLPAPDKGEESQFTGLEGDASYKFRILVKTPQGHSCHSDLLLKTYSPPLEGSFEVSPTSGDALFTNFTFSASNWTDTPGDRLTTYFGYRLESTDDNEGLPVAWPFTTTEEDPSTDLILPAGSDNAKIIPVMKICNSYDACTISEGTLLSISLPSQLPPEVLKALINNFKTQMKDDTMIKPALDTMTFHLVTLTSMGMNTEQAFLRYEVEIIINEKLNSLFSRMKPDLASIERSSDMLKGLLVMTDQFSIHEKVEKKMEILGKLFSAALMGEPLENIQPDPPQNTIEEDTGDAIYFPRNDQQLDAVRNEQNSRFMEESRWTAGLRRGNRRGVRRLKRDTSPANRTQQHRALNVEEVDIMLKASEHSIVRATREKNVADDMMKLLFTDLPKYYAGLCHGLSKQDPPGHVLGTLVAFTVLKSGFTNDATKKFPIADSKVKKNDFVTENSYVIWGDILHHYKTWSCGKKGDEGEDIPCYGACLSTTLLKEDFLAPLTGAKPPGELRTNVAETLLISFVTGVEIAVNMDDNKITYELVVHNDTKPEGYRFKCYGWDNTEWNKTYCNTGKIFTREGVKRLRCFCMSPVYVAGFLIKIRISETSADSTTQEPSTETTEPPKSLGESTVHLKIVIDEDFKTVVGNKTEEFILKIKPQIAKQLKVAEYRLINFIVYDGSIVVEFDVLPDPTRSSGSSDILAETLYEMINTGKLTIIGPTEEELRIPPQDFNGPLVEEKNDPTELPIIIGSVVGGIVLIMLVFICIAIYVKNKKRMDKVQPLQMTDSKQPTYSSIHFEQSLDGTMASLAKHRSGANTSNRSLSSGGAYSDEGIYIERRSTANSSRAGSGGRSAGGVSIDSGTGQDVPEAFRYRSPTKEQLERSGPIPEHIIQKIQAESEILPGTPENLA